MGVEQAHICLEATGHYGRDLAVALHEAGHVVSIVNPAQIRHFARTRLGRNKTDKVDAALIREYAEIFKPAPWSPPSPALRRLSELQTIRAGLVGNLTEWRNRKGSGLADPIAQALAEATIHHLAAQLAAVDNAIAETIDQDADLCRKRDLLLSISGVGEILTGLLLTEMPGPEVLRRGAEVSAYAGLATISLASRSIDRLAFPRSAMLFFDRRCTCPLWPPCARTRRWPPWLSG
jgi:transposase